MPVFLPGYGYVADYSSPVNEMFHNGSVLALTDFGGTIRLDVPVYEGADAYQFMRFGHSAYEDGRQPLKVGTRVKCTLQTVGAPLIGPNKEDGGTIARLLRHSDQTSRPAAPKQMEGDRLANHYEEPGTIESEGDLEPVRMGLLVADRTWNGEAIRVPFFPSNDHYVGQRVYFTIQNRQARNLRPVPVVVERA